MSERKPEDRASPAQLREHFRLCHERNREQSDVVGDLRSRYEKLNRDVKRQDELMEKTNGELREARECVEAQTRHMEESLESRNQLVDQRIRVRNKLKVQEARLVSTRNAA